MNPKTELDQLRAQLAAANNDLRDLREIECECPACHTPLIFIDGKIHTQEAVDNDEEDA